MAATYRVTLQRRSVYNGPVVVQQDQCEHALSVQAYANV
jgi:hypothetical protein